MNRKGFLQAFVPAALTVGILPKQLLGNNQLQLEKNPPILRQGSTVAIVCTANPVQLKSIEKGVQTLLSWGLQVKIGNTIGKEWQRFGGTDIERAYDLQTFLDDPTIGAIIFARGGYGTMRMIDLIDWSGFVEHPKWLIGFSDVTTTLLHVHTNFNMPSLHAGMITSITQDAKNITAISLHDVLFGHRIEYNLFGNNLNKEGFASGVLIGGNLSLLQACAGSVSDINTKDKILFIEDVSEYKYTIDRMLTQLKRSGKLSQLAGLIVGMFTATKKEEEDKYLLSIEEIILEKVQAYNFPVCFNFPSGHIRNNYALKMGVNYDLSVSKNSISLLESPTNNPFEPTKPKLSFETTLLNESS